MIYENGHWIKEGQIVTYAESIINKDKHEIMTLLYNWPDTNNLNIEIEDCDEENFKLTGKIENILLFIYNYILNYKTYILADILKNPQELSVVIEEYINKLY